MEIFDQEVCLLQSAAMWHVLAICSVSRLGEYHLRGGEYMLVCAHRGARMLRAAVEVVALKSSIAKRLHGIGSCRRCSPDAAFTLLKSSDADKPVWCSNELSLPLGWGSRCILVSTKCGGVLGKQ